jgi:pimeloyl-ACP methyl ester carboxylesterase
MALAQTKPPLLPPQSGEGTLWESFWSTSQDGLKLHTRLYGSHHSPLLPIVCLAGLARTSADFHTIAAHLSTHKTKPRHVLALDYRGRGRSDYDPNPGNYDPRIEMQDVQDVLTAVDIHEAIFIGTSRGGLITMGLSAARPGCIKGVVLNDIGPVIEGKGLARIKSYVGKLPKPHDYKEAVQILKRIASQHFTRLSDAEWEAFARCTFKESANGLVPDYDPALTKALESFDLEKPLPVLWPLFEGLKGVPMLSIRGEHSDILSSETQAEMSRRNPLCENYLVVGEGHAPLLGDKPTIQKIAGFVQSIA